MDSFIGDTILAASLNKFLDINFKSRYFKGLRIKEIDKVKGIITIELIRNLTTKLFWLFIKRRITGYYSACELETPEIKVIIK